MKIFRDFVSSIIVLPEAFGYLAKNRWCWKYVLIPYALNFLIFVLSATLVFTTVKSYLEGLTLLQSINPLFETTIYIFSLIIIITLCAYISFLLATIIASPFNGFMVEGMLSRAKVGKLSQGSGISAILLELKRSIQFAVMKIMLVILLFLASLLAGVVPIIGSMVATGMNFFGNAYLNVLDFYDPALAAIGMPTMQKFNYLKNHLVENSGLLIVTGFVSIIPVVNIVYIPLAAVAATLTFLKSLDR